MEECCKFVPIIVNGKYFGGNIVYCPKHAAAPEMYEALEWAYRVHGEHGGPLGLGAAMAAALAKAQKE